MFEPQGGTQKRTREPCETWSAGKVSPGPFKNTAEPGYLGNVHHCTCMKPCGTRTGVRATGVLLAGFRQGAAAAKVSVNVNVSVTVNVDAMHAVHMASARGTLWAAGCGTRLAFDCRRCFLPLRAGMHPGRCLDTDALTQ